jgi:hypothetical protein
VVRKPTDDELRLLAALVSQVEPPMSRDVLGRLSVTPLDDGGMGSLRLFPGGDCHDSAVFGRSVAECQFADADGVSVIATLNLDQQGHLFELDLWKVDFSPIGRIAAGFGPVRYGR